MKLKISILISLILFAFVNCTSEQKKTQHAAKSELTEALAKQYAMETQQLLGKNLIQAVGKSGFEGAIEFCSTKAIQLTDSSGNAKNVTIRRVTDKPRNPENQANESERKAILFYKNQLSSNKQLKPTTSTDNKGIQSHYIPILTNAMCLNCHGTQQIEKSTKEALEALYPNDKAIGYEDNEVRGIWVVEEL